jgi:hypothetical protein
MSEKAQRGQKWPFLPHEHFISTSLLYYCATKRFCLPPPLSATAKQNPSIAFTIRSRDRFYQAPRKQKNPKRTNLTIDQRFFAKQGAKEKIIPRRPISAKNTIRAVS